VKADGRGPYHPRALARRRRGRGLGLLDATAMGVGGMIGGGIFSVLGVAITLAGNLAFGCFVLGGVLAGATAWSYAGVTARSGASGGPFVELRERGHPELAGWLLWLLVFGYMVAMAVYSFTFGRYAANALGVGTTGARLLSIGIIAVFLAVNARGVRVSSLTEDVVVVTKLTILATVACVGVAHFDSDALTPLAAHGASGLFLGAATVFFAYEGFELISYDRDDMRDPHRTVPRALLVSVAIVAAIYIGVTLGAQMLVSNHAIVANKEVAFVAVGRAALGEPGRWLAISGALLATGSAINATLFSAARLVRDAGADHELPPQLGREHHGLPIVALAFISITGAAMAMLPGITSVIAVGSGAFLAVYTLVNFLQARAADRRWERVLAATAAAAAVLAIGVLVWELARDDLAGLVVFVGLLAAVAGARLAFRRRAGGAGRADGTFAPRRPVGGGRPSGNDPDRHL
jgi:amino acid transporter